LFQNKSNYLYLCSSFILFLSMNQCVTEKHSRMLAVAYMNVKHSNLQVVRHLKYVYLSHITRHGKLTNTFILN